MWDLEYIFVRSISAGHGSEVHQTFQKDPPPILYFSCRAAQSLPVLGLHSSSAQKKSLLYMLDICDICNDGVSDTKNTTVFFLDLL